MQHNNNASLTKLVISLKHEQTTAQARVCKEVFGLFYMHTTLANKDTYLHG